MKEKMIFIFNNVNEWLRFAEAKNGALLGFNSALLLAIVNILMTNTNKTNLYIYSYLLSGVFFIGISCITLILSFFPETLRSKNLQKEKNIVFNNYLYFGHLAKYDAEDFYKASKKQYSKKEEFEKDLAEQIVINSKISAKKYKFFRIAMLFLTCGLLTPVVGLLTLFFVRLEE